MPELRVGFIGLGRMGLPMSRRLLAAGFPLTVHNRSQGSVQTIAAEGAIAANSVAQVTAESDVVLACLPDVAASELVFLGEDGIVANARSGQVLVDHSTVGMETSKACAEAVQAKGAVFLDAPISGGTERAAEGTLTIMAGGPREGYDQALEVFDAMGATVRYMGPTGTGTVAKLINQLLVGIHSVAAAEAMLVGAKSGADPEMIFEVVNSGWGQSFMLGRNAPVMLDGDFSGVRTQLRIFLKDMGLIQDMTRELGIDTPAADLARRSIGRAVELGMGDLDSAAVVLPMEQDAGCEVRRLG